MMHSPEDILSLATMKAEIEQLRGEVAELTDSTRALVEAWNAAGSFIKFVKLISTLLAAIAAIWLFVTHGFGKS
jgi:hypothetical protein